MVKIWALTRIELVRLFRDRSNLFFVLLFPLLLIVFIGSQFSTAADTAVGVVGDDADVEVARFTDQLDALDGVKVRTFEDAEELTGAVERGNLSGGVVLPDGYGAALTAVEPVEVRFVGRPDATAVSLQALVGAVLAEQGQPGAAAVLLATARVSVGEGAQDVVTLRGTAVDLADDGGRIEVSALTVGVDALAEEFAGLGRFDLGASSQLFLFTFLTSLVGAAALIQTRQYGVATRMMSTPTSTTTVLLGIGGGRLAIAVFQASYIVVLTTIVFDVNWGDPLGAAAVIGLFCLVSAAAAMLVGSVFSNDSQASSAGIGLGLGSAALGGSMIPIELYPEGVARVARITPHAWANEAMAELVRREGGIVDVLPQLAALAGFALILGVAAAWSLRRALLR